MGCDNYTPTPAKRRPAASHASLKLAWEAARRGFSSSLAPDWRAIRTPIRIWRVGLHTSAAACKLACSWHASLTGVRPACQSISRREEFLQKVEVKKPWPPGGIPLGSRGFLTSTTRRNSSQRLRFFNLNCQEGFLLAALVEGAHVSNMWPVGHILLMCALCVWYVHNIHTCYVHTIGVQTACQPCRGRRADRTPPPDWHASCTPVRRPGTVISPGVRSSMPVLGWRERPHAVVIIPVFLCRNIKKFYFTRYT